MWLSRTNSYSNEVNRMISRRLQRELCKISLLLGMNVILEGSIGHGKLKELGENDN